MGVDPNCVASFGSVFPFCLSDTAGTAHSESQEDLMKLLDVDSLPEAPTVR